MRIERIGNNVRVKGDGPLDGRVRPPGSKSLTQRSLICAALADGVSVLQGALAADDTHIMADCLTALGAPARFCDDTGKFEVQGCGGHLRADDADLNVGHAGTAMRFLTALACLGRGRYRIDGSDRMRQRPIGPLVGALQELGAPIGYDDAEGFPPVTMTARGLAGGQVRFDKPPSSQFISAILMVAPYAARDVMLRVDGPLPSRPYVDLTLDVMRSMGVEILESGGNRFIVPASQRYRGGARAIEPDASSASYFFAAAAVTGGRMRVSGLSRKSRQGDVGFVDVLEQMGCEIDEGDNYLEVAAPVSGRLTGVTADLNAMPDVAQTLAVTALAADGPTEIRNVANLRIKETDRLAALAAELCRFDAKVDLFADGLRIFPPKRIGCAEIRTYDDHRMAMSFALAGLAGDGVLIREADCVSKSFPGYFDALATIPLRPKL